LQLTDASLIETTCQNGLKYVHVSVAGLLNYLSRPSLRILNVRVMIQPREITGPTQRDLQMGGEYSGGSHRRKLVLFLEDSSNLRVSMSTRSLEPMRDQRASMRSLFMSESGGLRFYGFLKTDGNVFIFMTKRRRSVLRLMDVETMTRK